MSRWKALLEVLGEPAQELELVFAQLLTRRYPATALGKILDEVGDFVGQPRNGVTDDELYRRYIFARILANFSKGMTETLIRIARLVLNDDAVKVYVENVGAAAVIVHLFNPVPDDVAAILIGFLKAAVKSGVRVIETWSPLGEDDTLYLSADAHVSGAFVGGSATLPLRAGGAAGWPQYGQVTIDVNAADEEVVSYASRDDDNLYFAPGFEPANNHDDGAQVTNEEVELGKGVVDRQTKLNGAHLAGALTIVVDDATGYDAAGTIQIDGGMSTQENVAYGSITGGNTFHITGTTFYNHADDATVTQGGGAFAGDAV